MSTPLQVVCFLEDTFLQSKDTIQISKPTDAPLGKLDSILTDYFSTLVTVSDTRPTRLTILPQPFTGHMRFLLDGSFLNDGNLLSKIPAHSYIKLFNLFEIATYMQGATTDSINTYLSSSLETKDIYVPDSFITSSTKSSHHVTGDVSIGVPKWFQVTCKFVGTDGISYIVLFKVFIDSRTFAVEYPYTTITKVIPPVDPAFFFGGVSYTSTMEAIIGSNIFINKKLDESIRETDQTGAHLVHLKYVVNADTSYVLPFQVLHKGPRRPSATASRKAIKDYLLGTGLVTEERLKELFPELFIMSAFYLIPLWDVVTERLDRKIEPGITPHFATIFSKVKRIDEELDANTFLTKGCLMLNGQNDLFTFAYPDPLNVDTRSLLELFPTFTSHATHEVDFGYMDRKDQELARWINTAFAVIAKTTTSDLYVPVKIDGRDYLNFSSGFTEFFILTKDSYMKLQ